MLKTGSGFEFEPYEQLGDDYRYIKAMKKLHSKDDEERIMAIDDIAQVVLGEEQAEKLMDHVAALEGYISTTKMTEELKEIIRLTGDHNKAAKN